MSATKTQLLANQSLRTMNEDMHDEQMKKDDGRDVAIGDCNTE